MSSNYYAYTAGTNSYTGTITTTGNGTWTNQWGGDPPFTIDNTPYNDRLAVELIRMMAGWPTQTKGLEMDEKKPWILARINSANSLCWIGCFASKKDAAEEAERMITADKSQRFALLKAECIIEPEPVKTRVREIK